MEGSNGKPFHTDQYAIVAHGKAEKEWPFLACSNARFTEVDLGLSTAKHFANWFLVVRTRTLQESCCQR